MSNAGMGGNGKSCDLDMSRMTSNATDCPTSVDLVANINRRQTDGSIMQDIMAHVVTMYPSTNIGMSRIEHSSIPPTMDAISAPPTARNARMGSFAREAGTPSRTRRIAMSMMDDFFDMMIASPSDDDDGGALPVPQSDVVSDMPHNADISALHVVVFPIPTSPKMTRSASISRTKFEVSSRPIRMQFSTSIPVMASRTQKFFVPPYTPNAPFAGRRTTESRDHVDDASSSVVFGGIANPTSTTRNIAPLVRANTDAPPMPASRPSSTFRVTLRG
jgi:hypothetical protein